MNNDITKKIRLLAFLAFTLLIQFDAIAQRGPRAVTVTTAVVEEKAENRSLFLIGNVKARNSVDIASEVAGKIETVHVVSSQQVQQGDLVVTLEHQQTLAEWREKQAELKNEQRILTELQALNSRNAVSKTELDRQSSKVEIAQARAEVAQVRHQQRFIRAPFTGRIGLVDLSKGQLVSSGQVLLSLDNVEQVYVDVSVPEKQLNLLSEKMLVNAEVDASPDVEFSGSIAYLDSRLDKQSLTAIARLKFENTNLQLKPGMLARVTVPLSEAKVTTVPVQSIQYSGTKRFVYRVDGDKANQIEVTLGERFDQRIAITSGLQPGDEVVVEGLVNMRPGVTIKRSGARAADSKSTPKSSATTD